MKKIDIQVEKDLKNLRRLSVVGMALVFGGLIFLTGFAQAREFGKAIIPSWTVIFPIMQIVIGFALTNMLTILKVICNPKEKAKFHKKIRKEANRCRQDFDDNIEIFGILFVGAMLCTLIILFI